MAGGRAVVQNFRNWRKDKQAESERMFKRYAQRAESHMKGSAEWQDVSGYARNALRAFSQIMGDGNLQLVLTTGPEDYQKFLIVANHRRFDILTPTMNLYGLQIYQELRRIWSS